MPKGSSVRPPGACKRWGPQQMRPRPLLPLRQRWNQLAPGETLELRFSAAQRATAPRPLGAGESTARQTRRLPSAWYVPGGLRCNARHQGPASNENVDDIVADSSGLGACCLRQQPGARDHRLELPRSANGCREQRLEPGSGRVRVDRGLLGSVRPRGREEFVLPEGVTWAYARAANRQQPQRVPSRFVQFRYLCQ